LCEWITMIIMLPNDAICGRFEDKDVKKVGRNILLTARAAFCGLFFFSCFQLVFTCEQRHLLHLVYNVF